jgi:ABC-type multidrug transport system fused ATPase/permease subunit
VFWWWFAAVIGYQLKYIYEALQAKDISQFWYHFAIITVFMILKSLPDYGVRLAKTHLKSRIQRYLYGKYIRAYLMITGNEADKLGTGQSNNILQRGCDNWNNILLEIPEAYSEVFVSLFLVFAIIGYELWRKFLLISLWALILTMCIAQYGNTLVAKRREARRDRMRKADRSTVKIIMSKQEILQSNAIHKELSMIDHELYQWNVMVATKVDKGLIYSMDIQKFCLDVLRLGVMIYIAFEIFEGHMTIGDFNLFRGLLWTFNANLEKVNDKITNYHQQIIYVTKLRDTFDTTPRIHGYDTWETFRYRQGNISLQNIHFNYWWEAVFQDFCLDIPGGKKIALVGSSGSGKTTLMKLIAGYLRPESGQVMVDHQDLMSVSLQSYYQHIGYLTQEPSVFDGTIRENLEYGTQVAKVAKDKKVAKELDDIIQLAKCEWIYNLPKWLDTEIWEKWVRLSGGQKQRLAIAKIFLKNPEIILLDEPTSALDSFSEESVTEAMENLFKGRTVIIIAHRLQTVKHADIIYLLEDGQVVEEGNHDALLAMNGRYAKMVEMQSGF